MFSNISFSCRFRYYTEHIQGRFEESTQEIFAKRGLYNQGVLIESQEEGSAAVGMVEGELYKEIRALSREFDQRAEGEALGFQEELALLREERLKLAKLINSKVNVSSLQELDKVEAWLEGSEARETFQLNQANSRAQTSCEIIKKQYQKNIL